METAPLTDTSERVAIAALRAKRHNTHFDYERQAWVVDGHYVQCGHSPETDCRCFGRLHEGEAEIITLNDLAASEDTHQHTHTHLFNLRPEHTHEHSHARPDSRRTESHAHYYHPEDIITNIDPD